MSENPIIISVDYSIRRPAVTLFTGKRPEKFVSFYKHDIKGPDVTLLEYPSWWCHEEERFAFIAASLTGVLPETKPDAVVFEGYAYSGKGRSFHLAEAAAFFKCMLIKKYGLTKFVSIQPSTIKKFATGNGRADKEDMISAFAKECPEQHKWLSGLVKSHSPLNDIADSYFAGKTFLHESSLSSALSS